VEYTSFEPPDLVAVSVTYSGRGSGGLAQTAVYRLAPAAATGGTHVTVEMDGAGGLVSSSINGLTWPLIWRRLRDRMERGGHLTPEETAAGRSGDIRERGPNSERCTVNG
jgi:hypothetical protein